MVSDTDSCSSQDRPRLNLLLLPFLGLVFVAGDHGLFKSSLLFSELLCTDGPVGAGNGLLVSSSY